MKNRFYIISVLIFVLAGLALVSAGNSFSVAFDNAPSDQGTICEGSANISVSSNVNTDELNIYLAGNKGSSLVSYGSGFNGNANFQSLDDDMYTINIESYYSENGYHLTRTFTNVNPQYFLFNEETPANNSLIRESSVSIGVVTNRNYQNLNLYVTGLDNEYASSVNSLEGNFNLEDGWYTFYAEADLINNSVCDNIVTQQEGFEPLSFDAQGESEITTYHVTETRTIYVDSHAPQIDNVTITPALANITNSSSVQYNLSFTSSEYPLVLKIRLMSDGKFNSTLLVANVTNSSQLPISFSISNIAIGNNYSIAVYAEDIAGNLNKTFPNGSFAVNASAPSVSEPEPTNNNPGNSGGGGGGGTPSSGLFFSGTNGTNSNSGFENLSNTGSGNETSDAGLEVKKGFFNAITGAVTGAMQKPGIRAALYFIAVLLAIFIAIRVREGFGSGKKEAKTKKAKKEVKEESGDSEED